MLNIVRTELVLNLKFFKSGKIVQASNENTKNVTGFLFASHFQVRLKKLLEKSKNASNKVLTGYRCLSYNVKQIQIIRVLLPYDEKEIIFNRNT